MNYNNEVNRVLTKAEQLMDEDMLDECEKLLDQQIAKYFTEIAKGKRVQPPPPPSGDDEDVADALEEEENASAPVKAKKFGAAITYPDTDLVDATGSGKHNSAGHQRRIKLHTQQPDPEDELDQGADESEEEDKVTKRAAEMDALNADTDQAMRVARIADAPGAHPLRKRAVQATLDALEQDLRKLGAGKPVRYPSSQGESVLQSNRSIQRDVTEFPDRSQHTVLPAVVDPKPSQFEAKVQQIMTERGISRSSAMVRTRIEFPDLFWAFQSGNAGEPTQAQQTRQSRYRVDKAALIAKGFSERVAMQKLAHIGIFPDEADVVKANSAYDDFRATAQELVEEGTAMPRTSAMRKARLENEDLYKRLNGI